MSKPKHFCYLPTQRLCELVDKLDDNFFPENYSDVIMQEIVTYMRHPSGMKKITFTRKFNKEGKHFDSNVSEVFVVNE